MSPPWTWPRRPAIVGGGAGLDSAARFEQLQLIATALGASLGATRVVTDRHWLSHQRQIGTTGVVVDPRLYLAFGISGAVQHTSGLGSPDHIVSVNLDASCPMMQLADLAIVADANAVLDELAARLGVAPLAATARPAVADVDVVVVGAGPAGSAAALDPRPRRLPRAAWSSGGRSPVPRTCSAASSTRASSTSCCPAGGRKRPSSDGWCAGPRCWPPARQALTVDYRTAAWGRPPYNGATAYRPDFDCVAREQGRGRRRRCSSPRPPSTGLLRDGDGRVAGVRTDRPGGEIDGAGW